MGRTAKYHLHLLAALQCLSIKFPDVFENRSSALSALFCLLGSSKLGLTGRLFMALYIPIRNDIFPVLIESLVECGIFLIYLFPELLTPETKHYLFFVSSPQTYLF